MELHSSKLTTLLLLWSVLCMQVRGDAMTPQTCNTQTSESCQAMIGYVPGSNYNLSQIAFLFTLNYTALLGPNDIDPSLQNLSKLVLPGSSNPYSIPQTCGCINGTRAVTSTNYTVVPGNTLSTISDILYSRLVTYPEIAEVNGIPDPDKIFPEQVFRIPIPCACFNQSNTTNSSIFLSYQIQSGDSLSMIADTHNTTAAYLQELNSLPTNSTLNEDSVLFIPLSVCKANFSSGALDKDLTAVEGKYELTANGCVQCNCHDGTLHCIEAPSSLGSSCSNTTCPSSNIRLGTSVTVQVNGACNVQSCVYKGYTAQSGIMSELETEEDPSCPVALPPESFYKPPLDLVASPLPGEATPITTTSPPPPSTPAATPLTPTTNNPNSATTLLVGISFYSWWWWLLVVATLLL